MGKKISGNKRSSGGSTKEGATENWTSTDHAIRKAKKQRRSDDTEKAVERARRSKVLTRDSKEKREESKLRLHIKLVQRQLEKLRERLQAWDDQEEKRLEKERLEKERKGAEAGPKKRKGRPGPETWKLKGAARPAWQVYDFDTRYVDPHMVAHEDAKKKAKRIRNIFSLCKGRFGEEDAGDVPQPYCREFLALLMQLGNLSLQANHLKTARQAFLECMELENTERPTTTARCQLMKLYLEANRPESARRLWERLPADDSSVWIRYSAALLEYVSWKLQGEEGSTEATTGALLAKAIKSNIFCAYYLAFWDSFQQAMDYTDEIEDATEENPLEEAIEYCNSEQGYGAWQGTEGALELVRDTLLSALQGKSNVGLTPEDLEWKEKLKTIKEVYVVNAESVANAGLEDTGTVGDGNDGEDESASEISADDDDKGDNGDDEESKVDGVMFAGMFETAMEMLEDSGKLKTSEIA